MLMELSQAQDIRISTHESGLVLVVTSEVGSEVVVDEIRIKTSDPQRLLRSLREGASSMTIEAPRPAA